MHYVVYLQRKTRLSGAQKSLLRLMTSPCIAPYTPILICEDKGWLYQAAVAAGITVELVPFPKSRSLAARLYRNRAFAKAIKQRLQAYPGRHIVHGNDYDECPLVLAVASALGCPSVLSLRNAGMTEKDWIKYRCDEVDKVIAVGQQIYDAAKRWPGCKQLELVYNGLADSEFTTIEEPVSAIRRMAVIGSILPIKGWQDMAQALRLLDEQPLVTGLQVDFVGRIDDIEPFERLQLASLKRIKVAFVGMQTDYINYLRQYNLVVNPSRGETFGMAAVECVAAGLPLLTTRVGVIEQVIEDQRLLVAAGEFDDLAASLMGLLEQGNTSRARGGGRPPPPPAGVGL
jgi:glycosyltransferase involved in cell wall biosynthesis